MTFFWMLIQSRLHRPSKGVTTWLCGARIGTTLIIGIVRFSEGNDAGNYYRRTKKGLDERVEVCCKRVRFGQKERRRG